jgi:tetratricopeptide (TPR) repeat protein
MRRFVLSAALLLLATGLSAQEPQPSDSTLVAALRLVSEGQGDSARAIVRERLHDVSPTDSTYAEVLYVAGAVADNADSALAYYRRVAIEHPESDWAPRALLRVGQLAFAAGDFAVAARSVDQVLSDYPFTAVRPAAAFWAGRVRIEQGKLAEACPLLQLAVDSAGTNVELANRARFYLQRWSASALDTSRADTARPASPSAPAGTTYAVQVAAVSSAVAANQTMQQLQTAGYDARVVRDASGLLKVRVGHFTTRAAADRLQAELKRKLGGSPFVVTERP